MPLVFVADLADTAGEVHSGSLLHHVGGFVGSQMKARGGAERYGVACGVRLGPHRRARSLRGSSDVGLDAGDVVTSAEQALDSIAVRQRRCAARDACSCQPLDITDGRAGWLLRAASLHWQLALAARATARRARRLALDDRRSRPSRLRAAHREVSARGLGLYERLAARNCCTPWLVCTARAPRPALPLRFHHLSGQFPSADQDWPVGRR
jgi:hypothetical protein